VHLGGYLPSEGRWPLHGYPILYIHLCQYNIICWNHFFHIGTYGFWRCTQSNDDGFRQGVILGVHTWQGRRTLPAYPMLYALIFANTIQFVKIVTSTHVHMCFGDVYKATMMVLHKVQFWVYIPTWWGRWPLPGYPTLCAHLTVLYSLLWS